jgi:hypothetical protein
MIENSGETIGVLRDGSTFSEHIAGFGADAEGLSG